MLSKKAVIRGVAAVVAISGFCFTVYDILIRISILRMAENMVFNPNRVLIDLDKFKA